MAELSLLGEVAVRTPGGAVELGPARQRCVLAALAVEVGRVVPAERLAERVWGGLPPLRVRPTLATYLSRLRRALAASDELEIVQRSGGYVLAAERSVVDLHRFRALCAAARDRTRDGDDRAAAGLFTEALGLWRGEALTGLHGEWAVAERDRLARERSAVEHDLVGVRLSLGHGEELVAEVAALAAEHPLDERVAGRHLLALYRAGRQAEALARYRDIRTRLADELGVDPCPDLQDLYQRILTADPSLTPPAPDTGADRPSPIPAPRQLPSPPRLFTGRADELAELDRVLLGDPDDGGRPPASRRAGEDAPDGEPPRGPGPAGDTPGDPTFLISVIGGAGGMGKTWLALAWADRNLHRFTDGQLFVDLRGFAPAGRPVDPVEALFGFLSALGVAPERVPGGPEARAALYRSLVADKHLLVVLDNAASPEQVEPLLPGGRGCTVLVTSRRKLTRLVTRHSAHHLDLGVLTAPLARALLVHRLGVERVAAEPDAVGALLDFCRGLPLALAVLAARAATDPGLPLARLVAELREHGVDALDDEDPAVSLPAVVSWSLRRLTAEQRTLFALLGVAPGNDIDLTAASSLAGTPVARTRAALRALEDASLVERDADGRYAMHDLVRECAAGVARDLPEADRRAALERVVDCYLHTADAACRLLAIEQQPFHPDPPAPGTHRHPLADAEAAMAWLDAEHPNVAAAQRVAVAEHRHRAVWHLALSLSLFHHRRGHTHDALVVWRAALDAARHLPDPVTRVVAHRKVAAGCARLGRHQEATEHLCQALALAERHRDHARRADLHCDLADVLERQGDVRGALAHARRALDLHRALGDPAVEACVLNLVGRLTAALGDHATARTHCETALALVERHPHLGSEVTIRDTLGQLDHLAGRHRQATGHYRRGLDLLRSLGHDYLAADTLDHLGHPHAALGEVEQARAAWSEALDLYRAQGRDDDARRVRRQLADLDGPTARQASPTP
ncbi:AfsR/SARP family transcriptional regulator [Saccharothrix australiensis]|uniref:DNA-binding SARP family transcriptional activator n=1 Tax=Saccharothrix australiensis TaxID=2072 RepID=A0A495W1N4_9PSEU|nr:BTAD domain-containing putative transcriptional regulator [Saccharothrix australiensis]RKT54633.1 DNA-binding SARP family transcriptional activator [Saccharothrix australiensis]